MEHIAALLLVIGCTSDLSNCREVAVDEAAFETQQACSRELLLAQRVYGREYSTVLFKCVAVDPALEHEDAELVWDVNSDGTLYAALETPTVMMALNGTTHPSN